MPDNRFSSYSRVLVTGADGFVGKHLVPVLAGALRPDAKLFTTTRQPSSASNNVVLFDLERPDTIHKAIERVRPDAIIHLAAQASVLRSHTATANTWEINLVGSITLAKAIAIYTPETTLLFASSAEVYGTTFNQEIVSEGSPLRPSSPYARSKAAAEAMFADLLPSSCRLIVARAANHSGAGQSTAFVIPAFAAQIAHAERGELDTISVGRLDSCRDFLAVEDVVKAYLLLLGQARLLAMPAVFNIASGECWRISDLLNILLSLATRRPAVAQDPSRMRPNEVPIARLNNTALRALGWEALTPIETMMAAVLDDQRRRTDPTAKYDEPHK